MEATQTLRYDAAAIAASEPDFMLDQMVHEYVMGCAKPKLPQFLPVGIEKDGWVLGHAHGAGYAPSWCAPKYSTDAALLWKVVGQLQQEGFWVGINTLGADQFCVKVSEPDTTTGEVLAPWPKKHENAAPNALLAVCRVALLAKLNVLYPGCAAEPAPSL